MTYHTTEELIGGRSEWAVSPNNFNGLIDSHILANQRISELEAQLAVEKKKVADLEKPAAFGWQCYQDRCENAYIEQSVVRKMEAQLAAEKFTSEQLQKTIDSMAATEAKHAAEMSRCLKGMDEANEKLRERLTARGAKLKAAREALEIARQETRIAAVMLDQVEPSAAITVKESDRLHLAANKMRTVSDLSDKALVALDGEV